MRKFLKWCVELFRSQPGDWMDKAPKTRAKAVLEEQSYYDPDEEFEALAQGVKNPVFAAMESVKTGTATIREAWLFEARVNRSGRMMSEVACKEAYGSKLVKPYRMRFVEGTDAFTAKIAEGERSMETVGTKLKEGFSDGGGQFGPFDPNQYTEYTPLYGGPFFKQLYLYDYLQMHARAFEAWNHNPLAKRIINILSQYTLGRGYKPAFKDDEAAEKAWDAFERETELPKKMREWLRERLLYGELMVDNVSWSSIDPSTVWDIITDPDNISKVYYYHQQYSTAYFQFTGKQVPGVPGSAQTKPIEYIIRQIPFDRVIHLKGESVSNEKRGRSILFPVLGWLKRIKDLYNSEVIRAQLQASFIWDDTIKGSDADVQAHASKYSSMPLPGSVFAHNEAVERKPMPVMETTNAGKGGVGAEILSFVATAVGIPKDFFNVMAVGGGSRATALVGAEPFSKVVEELQVEMEELLHRIASIELPRRGVPYDRDKVEFIFPSVTKDTTTETLKNIMEMESQGYIAKRTAGEMAAAEMNITTYDYEKEQTQAADDKVKGLDQVGGVLPPAGRMGGAGLTPPEPAPNELHGDGAADLKDELQSI